MNKKSIGIEIINPYSPDLDSKKIQKNVIYFSKKPWWLWVKETVGYILPTKKQLNSLNSLLVLLTDQISSVPVAFPTILNKQKISADKIEPGIVAHCDFGKHSDGRWPLEWVYKNGTY